MESLGLDRVVGSFFADISLFCLFYSRRDFRVPADLADNTSPCCFRPRAARHAIWTCSLRTPSFRRANSVVVAPISGPQGEDGPSLGLVTATLDSPLPHQHCRAPTPASPAVVHCGSWTGLRSVCTRLPFPWYDGVEVTQGLTVTSLSRTTWGTLHFEQPACLGPSPLRVRVGGYDY